MSEVMTQGIIGMPYDLAMGDELSRRQFYSRAQSLLADYAALEAELAKLRAGQEPVGEVQLKTGGGISLLHVDLSQPLPPGTKLYTTPQPSAVPVVHGLDADDVRAACQNAIEVFADEENAEQCREVAEYMREVLLVDLGRAAPATVQGVNQQLLEAVIAAFEFVNKSGEHDSVCDVFDLDDDDRHKDCNCGLDAIIRALYAAIAAARQEGGKV